MKGRKVTDKEQQAYDAWRKANAAEHSKLWAPPDPNIKGFACSPQELIAKFETDAAYEARYREWIGAPAPEKKDEP